MSNDKQYPEKKLDKLTMAFPVMQVGFEVGLDAAEVLRANGFNPKQNPYPI